MYRFRLPWKKFLTIVSSNLLTKKKIYNLHFTCKSSISIKHFFFQNAWNWDYSYSVYISQEKPSFTRTQLSKKRPVLVYILKADDARSLSHELLLFSLYIILYCCLFCLCSLDLLLVFPAEIPLHPITTFLQKSWNTNYSLLSISAFMLHKNFHLGEDTDFTRKNPPLAWQITSLKAEIVLNFLKSSKKVLWGWEIFMIYIFLL